jgi:hypothetical protein
VKAGKTAVINGRVASLTLNTYTRFKILIT